MYGCGILYGHVNRKVLIGQDDDDRTFLVFILSTLQGPVLFLLIISEIEFMLPC